MSRFTFVDGLLRASWLVALAAAGGCVALPGSDRGHAVELRAVRPAVADAGQNGPRCPLRHVYVCARESRAQSGTCYCAPEPESATPQPGGLPRTF